MMRVVLGDIGATNARFALASENGLGEVRSFEVAKFPLFMDALAVFLKDVNSPLRTPCSRLRVLSLNGAQSSQTSPGLLMQMS